MRRSTILFSITLLTACGGSDDKMDSSSDPVTEASLAGIYKSSIVLGNSVDTSADQSWAELSKLRFSNLQDSNVELFAIFDGERTVDNAYYDPILDCQLSHPAYSYSLLDSSGDESDSTIVFTRLHSDALNATSFTLSEAMLSIDDSEQGPITFTRTTAPAPQASCDAVLSPVASDEAFEDLRGAYQRTFDFMLDSGDEVPVQVHVEFASNQVLTSLLLSDASGAVCYEQYTSALARDPDSSSFVATYSDGQQYLWEIDSSDTGLLLTFEQPFEAFRLFYYQHFLSVEATSMPFDTSGLERCSNTASSS